MVFSFLEAHSTSAFDDDDGECRVAAWPWPSRLGGQRERHKMLLEYLHSLLQNGHFFGRGLVHALCCRWVLAYCLSGSQRPWKGSYSEATSPHHLGTLFKPATATTHR